MFRKGFEAVSVIVEPSCQKQNEKGFIVPMEYCLVFRPRLFRTVRMLPSFTFIKQTGRAASRYCLSWTPDEFIASWIPEIPLHPARAYPRLARTCQAMRLHQLRSDLLKHQAFVNNSNCSQATARQLEFCREPPSM